MEIKAMSEHHGRRIESYSTCDGNPQNYGSHLAQAHLAFEYLGDHAEVWVVITLDGIEIGRESVRFLASIAWWPKED